MGQKAKNAGKKKTKQFEAKLATTKSLAPTAGRIKWNKTVVLGVAGLNEQQRAELARELAVLHSKRQNNCMTQKLSVGQNNWLGMCSYS